MTPSRTTSNRTAIPSGDCGASCCLEARLLPGGGWWYPGDMAQRIGIVGTGWVADKHVEALAKVPEARIAAIAGRNAARVGELAAKAALSGPRPNPYSGWAEMLAAEDLDAVLILLPPHLHGDIEVACAGRVPALLIEKPVANALATAERALEAFEAAGTFAAAAYMNRCRRSVARARELFSGPGRAPVLVRGRWVTPMPPPAWWRDKALSGGQFVEQCTHLVDLARFVAGEVAEVSAFSATGFVDDAGDYATDDAMAVNLRFASGALGQFSTGCFPRPGLDDDEGIGLEFRSRGLRCRLSGWGMALDSQAATGGVESIEPEADIFEAEDRLFLRAAAAGDPGLFPSSYADALETLRVTLAANESAAAGGKPIKLR